MVQLRREGRLLSQVKGKPHATSDDHEALPTPPATNSTRFSMSLAKDVQDEEDIMRDPDSSDDGEPSIASFKHATHLDGTADERPKPAKFRTLASLETKQPHEFRQFKQTTSFSPGSKRSSDDATHSSEGDEIFGSQESYKRRKPGHQTNLFAPQRKAKPGYGRASRVHSGTPGSEGMKMTKVKEQVRRPEPQVTFKKPTGLDLDMFEFGSKVPEPAFKVAGGNRDGLGIDTMDAEHSSSPLSSPRSSPEVEEIKQLNLPAPQNYTPKTECAMCGQEVDLLFKQEFEDDYLKGKPMNYKWQQRFCRRHREHEAKEMWKLRGYPKIDWQSLDRRIRRYHLHLKDCMSGARPSRHRHTMSEMVAGRTKTAVQAFNPDHADTRASTGYYGPRGRKVM